MTFHVHRDKFAEFYRERWNLISRRNARVKARTRVNYNWRESCWQPGGDWAKMHGECFDVHTVFVSPFPNRRRNSNSSSHQRRSARNWLKLFFSSLVEAFSARFAQTFELQNDETCSIYPLGRLGLFAKRLPIQIHPQCSWINHHVLSAFYGQSSEHFSFKFHWEIGINWDEEVLICVCNAGSFVTYKNPCWDDFSVSLHEGSVAIPRKWQRSHLGCRRTELSANLKFNITRSPSLFVSAFFFLGKSERKKNEKWVSSHD